MAPRRQSAVSFPHIYIRAHCLPYQSSVLGTAECSNAVATRLCFGPSLVCCTHTSDRNLHISLDPRRHSVHWSKPIAASSTQHTQSRTLDSEPSLCRQFSQAGLHLAALLVYHSTVATKLAIRLLLQPHSAPPSYHYTSSPCVLVSTHAPAPPCDWDITGLGGLQKH